MTIDYKEMYDAALKLYMELMDSSLRQKQEYAASCRELQRQVNETNEGALKRDNELAALLHKKDADWGRDKEFLLKETRRLESELDSAREVKEKFAIEANHLRAELESLRARHKRADTCWDQVKAYVIENQTSFSYFPPEQWERVTHKKKFSHLVYLLLNAVNLDPCHE